MCSWKREHGILPERMLIVADDVANLPEAGRLAVSGVWRRMAITPRNADQVGPEEDESLLLGGHVLAGTERLC